MRRRGRVVVTVLLKLALSSAMVWWAASPVDLVALASHVDRIDWPWLIPLMVLAAGQVGLLCRRFALVLSGVDGGRHGGSAAVRTVLAGLLFNQTLPANIGGDVARVVLLEREGMPRPSAISAVVADRIAGLLAMMLSMGATLPLLPTLAVGTGPRAALFWTDALAASAAVATLLLLRWMPRLTTIPHRLAAVEAAVRAGLFGAGRLPEILLYGLAGHLATAMFVVCIAAALGIPLTGTAALVLVPPVLLLAQLPISVGGWGVREASMVTALGVVGIPAEAALLVSLGLGVVTLVQGLAAGLAWSVGTGGGPLLQSLWRRSA